MNRPTLPTGSLDEDPIEDLEVRDAVRATQRALGENLQGLALFGSFLSPRLRKPDSIPDLFAVVGDVQGALASLQAPRGARLLAGILLPSTLALSDQSGRTLAKINLAQIDQIEREVTSGFDLYLAGRLSKPSRWLHGLPSLGSRWNRCGRMALERVARLSTLGLPRRISLEDVYRRAWTLSYAAELRPESSARRAAAFDAAADHARHELAPVISDRALELGVHVEDLSWVDRRPLRLRAIERLELEWALLVSRARSVARWPKQALSYRGWMSYVRAKVRRTRSPSPHERTVGDVAWLRPATADQQRHGEA